MLCPKCHAPLSDNARFCTKCGASLTVSQETEPLYGTPSPAAGYQPDRTENMPADLGMTDKERKAAQKRDLKDSKEAYKQARKNAGKSNAPKVVGALVAVVAIAAIAVAGTLFATGALNGSDTTNAADTANTAVVESSTNAASDANTNANTNTDSSDTSNYAAYEGTWTGEMTSVGTMYNNKKCYGATGNPATLTISSVSSTGQVNGTLKVLWHGHKASDLENDVNKHDGDKYVTISNFTTSFKASGEMSFKGEVDGSKNYVKVSYKYEKANSSLKVILTVDSYADGDKQFTDTYELTKAN